MGARPADERRSAPQLKLWCVSVPVRLQSQVVGHVLVSEEQPGVPPRAGVHPVEHAAAGDLSHATLGTYVAVSEVIYNFSFRAG